MECTIRRACLANTELIRKVAAETFWEAYHGHPKIRDVDLQSYIDEAFQPKVITKTLARGSSIVFVAEICGEPIGYAQLNLAPQRSVIEGERPMELERLYTKNKVWGKGVGQTLLDACVRKAAVSSCDWLWISVWEFNDRALSFYRRNKFEIVGSEHFQLGSYRSNDLLLRKRI